MTAIAVHVHPRIREAVKAKPELRELCVQMLTGVDGRDFDEVSILILMQLNYMADMIEQKRSQADRIEFLDYMIKLLEELK